MAINVNKNEDRRMTENFEQLTSNHMTILSLERHKKVDPE